MSMYNYPAPCCPDYKKPARIEDCLSQARQLVKKLTAFERPPFLSVAPQFYIKEGDKVLIVTLLDQDQYVADAKNHHIPKGKGTVWLRFADRFS